MNPLQRLRRSARITSTAARIGAGYRWRSWRYARLPDEETERRMSAYHRRCAERIFETATELKGLLIKVGQILGARADIVPKEYVEVLSRLHDAVPPHPYGVIRGVIESELGASVEEVFSELDRTPIAAASLAQVHRGRLHDGREVAVKVQYPEIEEIVRTDIQNIRMLGRVADRVFQAFDIMPIVEELASTVPLELDFINEGHNAEASARNFADQPDVIVPDIYWEHTTKRLLVMEFVDGIKITDMAAIDAAGIDRQEIARLVMGSYFRQIFVHGFFHADPHPGNLFVRPGPKLVIVDYGLAKELPPEFLRNFAGLTHALVAADTARLVEALRGLGFRTRDDDESGLEAMAESMVTWLSRNGEFNQDSQLMAEFQDNMMHAYRENPIVRIPSDFLFIGRVMGLLGGLGKQLGSQLNLLDVLGSEVSEAEKAPS